MKRTNYFTVDVTQDGDLVVSYFPEDHDGPSYRATFNSWGMSDDWARRNIRERATRLVARNDERLRLMALAKHVEVELNKEIR